MSQHPIVHIEMAAGDLDQVSRFYAQVFGWKVEHIPEMNHSTFEAEGGPGGGFAPVGEFHKPGDVIPYIGTDDIEATLARVEAEGGKVLQPKAEILGTGWFALFADPSGNRDGLYTPLQA